MKKLANKIKNNETLVDMILILLIAILLSIPNFSAKADIYFDDGSQHLMRAYGTYQTIKQGGNHNVISNFVNGFGYSWDLFYGPLSTDCIMVLGILFHSFNLGFKIMLCLILFLAGSFMYKFMKQVVENKNIALLASMIYMTAPYFFTDLFIRHAIGECFTFVWLPMVFLGLYQLFNTEKNHYYLVIGGAGLILSHNISTVLTVIFVFVYIIVHGRSLASTRVKKGLLLDIVFILLLTSFFWVPLLQNKAGTSYRAFETNAMATKESLLDQTLEVKDLFITQNGAVLVFEIGLPVILMLAFSVMTFRQLEENRKEYIFFLLAGLVSVWMATKYFPWKWLPDSFCIIQFPWRMLVFSSFFFAIVCSMNMGIIIKNFGAKDVLILSIVCILYLFSKYEMIPYSDTVEKVEDSTVMNVSGQANEWLPGMGRLEYLPSKAYQDTFYIATRESGICVLEGECETKDEVRMGNYWKTEIETMEEKAKIELPFIYYTGYTVRLDGMILDTLETENGFLGVYIEANETGELEVTYTGTKTMALTNGISLITLFGFVFYVWRKH